MESQQLRYFVAAAESGNLTRAAEKCGIAQPSLSQQIMKLERELGRPLFDRIGRRVELTESGRLLLERAGPLLAALDDLRREMCDVPEPGEGRLRVGAIATVAPYLLPPAVNAFLRRYPRVDLQIQENLTERLLAALRAGELDLAVLALPVDEPHLEHETLVTEPLLAALPGDHRLARKSQVTLSELRDERFVVLDEMHCLGNQIAGFCSQLPFPLSITCRSTQISTIQALIALGQGVSLLPAMARDADRSSQRAYVPLTGAGLARTLAAVWHKNRYKSPNMQRFVEFLRKTAQGYKEGNRLPAGTREKPVK
jgi:LysR family hydrogen peroxide-inducible transcriptional activator